MTRQELIKTYRQKLAELDKELTGYGESVRDLRENFEGNYYNDPEYRDLITLQQIGDARKQLFLQFINDLEQL